MNNDFETVITSGHSIFDLNLKEVWKYRDLIILFIKRMFITQYKQTVLGPAWAFVQPLCSTIVFTIIFGKIAGLSAGGVPSFVFYFSGNILWIYFSASFTEVANTFVNNANILGKVYFPRLVMPVSTVMSHLIMFFIQYMMFIVMAAYYALKGTVQPNLYVLMTPVIVLQLALLSLSCGIIVSSLTTKYRDLTMLVSFFTQFWMYATPVAYDIDKMQAFAQGGKWHTLYMLNPVTPPVILFRYAYLGSGSPEWGFYFISWGMTAALLAAGLLLFGKVERTFTDTI